MSPLPGSPDVALVSAKYSKIVDEMPGIPEVPLIPDVPEYPLTPVVPL